MHINKPSFDFDPNDDFFSGEWDKINGGSIAKKKTFPGANVVIQKQKQAPILQPQRTKLVESFFSEEDSFTQCAKEMKEEEKRSEQVKGDGTFMQYLLKSLGEPGKAVVNKCTDDEKYKNEIRKQQLKKYGEKMTISEMRFRQGNPVNFGRVYSDSGVKKSRYTVQFHPSNFVKRPPPPPPLEYYPQQQQHPQQFYGYEQQQQQPGYYFPNANQMPLQVQLGYGNSFYPNGYPKYFQ